MNGRLLSSVFLIWMALAACGQIPAPAGMTSAAPPSPTPRAGLALTATSISMSTPIPTPIGAAEPKVAFVGKDVQGNLGIYVDGLYLGSPEKIAVVTLAAARASYLPMRWSPDGRQLMFVNANELQQESFFLFDTKSGDLQEIARVPEDLTVTSSDWSADGRSFSFRGGASKHQTVSYRLDLADGGLSQAADSSFINNNSHVNSLADCSGKFPTAVQILSFAAAGGLGPNGVIYDRICFYPALKFYAGLKYNQDSTEFVLLTEKGEVKQTLVRFPAQYFLNGFMDMSLSPDGSRLLLVGEGGSDRAQSQFVIPIQIDKEAIDRRALDLKSAFAPLQVFGWSPDSQHYLVAESGPRLEVMQAFPQQVAFKYIIHSEVTPLFQVSQTAAGFDMVWPASP
jgi:hypothetical protein